MAQDTSLSTEEKILKAAARVFIRKGFAATKTRDIADEAGINIASLHYYFRSKDKLFEIVIGDAMRKFSKGLDDVMNSDQPLHVKIKLFVNQEIEFFKANPDIPLFIMSESQINAEKLSDMLNSQKTLDVLKSQLEELSNAGVIRPISYRQLMVNMISLTVFPFIGKPLMMHKLELTESTYYELLEERKQMIPDMIISYLYLQKPD